MKIGGGDPKGDFTIPEGHSIIMTSPDGSKYEVSIENGGRVISTLV